jgi:O-antigen/teichoic acid export membrane protein
MIANNTKSITKNSLWLAISEIINGLLMFFLTIFLARHLGVEGYGKLTFALSFVTLFIIPIDAGLSPLATRELAGEEEKTKKYLDNLVLIRVILRIIAFLLITLIIQILGKESDVKNLVYLLGIWTIFQTSTQFLQAIFRAHEKMFFEAITRIVHALILTLLSLYFIWFNFDITYFGWAYCIASLLTLILAFIFVWRNFSHFTIRFDTNFIKNIFKKSWPFALSLLFTSIYYYIDSVMLGIMKNNEEVGLYNAAYKLIIFILIMGSVINKSTYPVISKLYKSSQSELKIFLEKYSRYIFILAIPIAFGGITLSSQAIYFIYGENFSKSILPFQILVVSAAITYISTIYAHALQICKKQKTHLLGMGIGAFINIGLNLIFIPYLGLVGAAITTLVTEIFILIFMYINFSKIIELNVLKHAYKPLIASLLMIVALYYLPVWNLLILIIIGLFIYFIIIFLIKGLSYKDLSILKNLLKK